MEHFFNSQTSNFGQFTETSEKINKHEEKSWEIEKNTALVSTNAFGSIKFQGSDIQKKRKAWVLKYLL